MTKPTLNRQDAKAAKKINSIIKPKPKTEPKLVSRPTATTHTISPSDNADIGKYSRSGFSFHLISIFLAALASWRLICFVRHA
jgi:hypothetical protein